jgi:ArsR family transcriptional regulator
MLSYSESAMLFKALSDETRLKIIDMLSCDELCACDILEEFAITQPTLSYHMKMMTESGLVNGRNACGFKGFSGRNHNRQGKLYLQKG